MMTADELRRIALRLANSCWCRHWLHWNYPHEDPWLMAISVFGFPQLQRDGQPVSLPVPELLTLGFSEVPEVERYLGHLYVVDRTDDAGRPYTSPL